VQVGFGIETLKTVMQPLCQIIKSIKFNWLVGKAMPYLMIAHQNRAFKTKSSIKLVRCLASAANPQSYVTQGCSVF
jgi:hypothetical protein